MTEPISETLKHKHASIDNRSIDNKNKFNYSSIDYRRPTNSEAEHLVDKALRIGIDDNFKPYFFKTAYMIGVRLFDEALEHAQNYKGAKCIQCVFVHRLKQHRNYMEKVLDTA